MVDEIYVITWDPQIFGSSLITNLSSNPIATELMPYQLD